MAFYDYLRVNGTIFIGDDSVPEDTEGSIGAVDSYEPQDYLGAKRKKGLRVILKRLTK